MLIPCEGRPATARGVGYPPLELMVGGGVEVLVNLGTPQHRSYEFVAQVH